MHSLRQKCTSTSIVIPKAMLCSLAAVILLTHDGAYGGGGSREQRGQRTASVENIADRSSYARFDVNRISTVIMNNGSFNRDPVSGSAGFEWPKGTGNTANYASGIWIGGRVGDSVRAAVAEYPCEFDAGPLAPGVDPLDARWKVYRIQTGDNALNNPDYANWPFDDGAPALTNAAGGDSLDPGGDRIPLLLGHMTAWTVFNDNNPLLHTKTKTAPLGLEVQMTAFGYNRSDALGRTIFYRWKIINKGGNTIDEAHLAIWSDVDLGMSNDDFDGCDTVRSLGYTYNGDGFDGIYGSTPPATGFTLLQGPLVLGAAGDTAKAFGGRRYPGMHFLQMTSFVKYTNDATELGDPKSAEEVFNFMEGRGRSGAPVMNPSGQVVTRMYPGNPRLPYDADMNWIETGHPSDRRFLMSSGPFTMAPGDTQEIVAANIIAQDIDHLRSVTALKGTADYVRLAFQSLIEYGDINLHTIAVNDNGHGSVEPPAPVPVLHGGDVTITLMPEPGYHIDSVMVNGAYRGTIESYTFVNVRGDSSMRVVYAINEYSISSAAGPHGSITPGGAVSVPYGGSQRFAYAAETDFQVDSVLVDGSVMFDSTDGYTFDTVVADHTIWVAFGPIRQTKFIVVDSGWNLLSLPLQVKDNRPGAVYPSAGSSVFGYANTSYEIEDSLTFGRGFWVKFAGSAVVDIPGSVRSRDTIEVSAGWNLIGSLSTPVSTVSVTSEPPGMITSVFYTYAGAYHPAESLLAGKGHWVKVAQPGELILSSPGAATGSRIRISPTAEMPPPPPQPQMPADRGIPQEYALLQAYPSPFNPVTSISYDLTAESYVSIVVYDVLGRIVGTIVEGVQAPGRQTVRWDAAALPSGVYMYRLEASALADRSRCFRQTRKVMLMK